MNKLTKLTFNMVGGFINLLKIFCLFYVFFLMIYWFLSISENPLAANIAFLFEPAINFVRIFYTHKPVIDEEHVDLAAIVCAIMFFLLSLVFQFLGTFVISIERKVEKKVQEERRRKDESEARLVRRNLKKEMDAYKYFVFFINADFLPSGGYKSVKDFDSEKALEFRNDFYLKMATELDFSFVFEKNEYKDSFYFVCLGFENLDVFLTRIKKYLKKFAANEVKSDFKVQFYMYVDLMKSYDDIAKIKPLSEKVMQLKMSDEVLTTRLFKSHHETYGSDLYGLDTKGLYDFEYEGEKLYNFEIFGLKSNQT